MERKRAGEKEEEGSKKGQFAGRAGVMERKRAEEEEEEKD